MAQNLEASPTPEPVRQLPWSHVYGLARSLVALATMATLAANHSSVLWRTALGIPEAPICTDLTANTTLFCLLRDHLELARWIAVALLAVVVSGWRPRITGVVHWWVTSSFITTAVLVDGGDHLSATLSLLLIPLTLTDPRRWHWSSAPAQPDGTRANLQLGMGVATLWVLRLQVAVVYLNAAAAKWSVDEWANGTALYYWFTDPAFGFTPFLQSLLGWSLAHGFTVTLMTWGVIVFEFSLFAGLFIGQRLPRQVLLAMGIAFHMGIVVVHGLPSFATIMFGALILLLRREDEPFGWIESIRSFMSGGVSRLVGRRKHSTVPKEAAVAAMGAFASTPGR